MGDLRSWSAADVKNKVNFLALLFHAVPKTILEEQERSDGSSSPKGGDRCYCFVFLCILRSKGGMLIN